MWNLQWAFGIRLVTRLRNMSKARRGKATCRLLLLLLNMYRLIDLVLGVYRVMPVFMLLGAIFSGLYDFGLLSCVMRVLRLWTVDISGCCR